MQKGLEAWRRGDYDAAEKLLAKALPRREAALALADLLARRGRSAAALRVLDRLEPDGEVQVRRALLQYDREQIQAATQTLRSCKGLRGAERARLEILKGLLAHEAGRGLAARRALEKAVKLRRRAAGLELADALLLYGRVLRQQGAVEEAQAALDEARRLCVEELGARHPRTAEIDVELALLVPEQTETRLRKIQKSYPEPGSLLIMRAAVAWEEGRLEQARRLARQAVGIERETQAAEDGGAATAMSALALYEAALGHTKPACKLYSDALERYREAFGEHSAQVATTLYNLASVTARLGDVAAAQKLCREALAVQRRLGSAPSASLIAVLLLSADLEQRRGRVGAALLFLQRALRAQERLLQPHDPDVLATRSSVAGLLVAAGRGALAERLYLQNIVLRDVAQDPSVEAQEADLRALVMLYRSQGDLQSAEPFHRRLVESLQRRHQPDDPTLAEPILALADWYDTEGRYDESEPLYEALLSIEAEPLATVDVLLRLALARFYQHQYEAAKSLFAQALPLVEDELGAGHSLVATICNNLAEVEHRLGNLDEAKKLLRHAIAVDRATGGEQAEIATCMHNLAQLLTEQERFSEAEQTFQKALMIWERIEGPEHLGRVQSLGGLGQLMALQGRATEARAVLERALSIGERVLPASSPLRAMLLHTLAEVHHNLDEYASAESLYRQAILLRELALGTDAPELAMDLQALASCYCDQNRYEDAGPLLEQAVDLLARARGDLSPELGPICHSLAVVYHHLGQLDAARSMWEWDARVLEAERGPDDPALVEPLRQMGLSWFEENNYEAARRLLQRALALREKQATEGRERPGQLAALAQSLRDLAVVEAMDARYPEAEALYRRALAIWEQELGPDNVMVSTLLMEVADMVCEEGRHLEAEPLYARALEIREDAMGLTAPEVLRVLDSQMNVFRCLGDLPAATERCEEILKRCEMREHLAEETANTLVTLAELFRIQGLIHRAAEAYRRAVAIRAELFGPQSMGVAEILDSLAAVTEEQGRSGETEGLLLRSLHIYEESYGADDTRLCPVLGSLAAFYGRMGRFADAQKNLTRAVAIEERRWGPQHLEVALRLDDLARLYTAKGRILDAVPLWQRCLAIYEGSVGDDDWLVAATCRSLGEAFEALGDEAEAERCYRRALQVGKRPMGAESTPIAEICERLAALYVRKG
ncbi:MAG: tetratricopeptide repeat protein, partial [Candidatus Xenobia bacterium]